MTTARHDFPVAETTDIYRGKVMALRADEVVMPGGRAARREIIEHPGAVAIAALDPDDRIMMIHQYRHALGRRLWELPAGLLDVAGEQPWLAAARELHEEADLVAGRWDVLTDFYGSPGGLSEALRIFLARDLLGVHHDDRFTREGEEHGMPVGWVDLEEAHEAVLAGRLHNPAAVVGILTAHASRARDWTTLRPHDAPWPEHPAYR